MIRINSHQPSYQPSTHQHPHQSPPFVPKPLHPHPNRIRPAYHPGQTQPAAPPPPNESSPKPT